MTLSGIRPQRSLLATALMVMLLSVTARLHAQEYVGVLPELLKPEVSERLGLSEQQREELQQLMRSRISAAVGLSQQLREAPLDQHARMREAFAAESEQLAQELLSEEQQRELSMYRLEWLGLLSLAEEDVAEVLNLADWQRELVDEWRERVRDARRGPESERVRSSAEQDVRRNISESQWAAWQLMAGIISESSLGEPRPPERDQRSGGDRSGLASAVGENGGRSPSDQADVSRVPLDQIELVMNFQRQPWEDVIAWLAEQADLSVQSNTIPPGSFTYRDRSRTYSVTDALDIMNAALLDSGYTLFRQGRMLRCIDFEQDQEKAGEVIRELADYVDEETLRDRGRYEPVRYLFTLDRLDPEEIKEEVEELLSIQGTAISLPSSGQLVVTDMAGHVRTIADYIRRAEDPSSARGGSIQSFSLESITAEEVLSVARPLLGLEPETNTSDEISFSTNTFGTVIYAKGAPDKIQNLRDLIDKMDRPPEEGEESVSQYEAPYIDRHRVSGFDLQLAYNVVSQLLAGSPDVRLAPDETAKQLVLYARSDEHELVKKTLDTLAGEASDFAVIQLDRLDPQLAIAAIKKFFGLNNEGEEGTSNAPVVDGDVTARQVWVKGSAAQVARIRDFVNNLEENSQGNDLLGGRVRMIPLSGRSAEEALRQVEAIWQQSSESPNSLRFITPGRSASPGLQQRTFAPQQRTPENEAVQRQAGRVRPTFDAVRPPSEPRDSGDEGQVDQPDESPEEMPRSSSSSPFSKRDGPSKEVPGGLMVTRPGLAGGQESDEEAADSSPSPSDAPGTADERAQQDQFEEAGEGRGGTSAADGQGRRNPNAGSDIVIMEGPGGLIISSEDKEALNRFESLLRLVSDQAAFGSAEPVVVYLRNIEAVAAKELLESILSGTGSSDGGDGGLLGDMAGSMLGGFGGGMFGAMLGGDGGGDLFGSTVGMASGDYSIVADPRLNALVIKASPVDMTLIEQLLEVIDQVESPYAIETRGQTKLIPVITQDVTQVINMIKGVYGDQIAGESSSGGGRGGGGQPNPAEIIEALRGGGRGGRGGRGGGGGGSQLSDPKISLGADVKSNILIVRAQPHQIQEIEQLVAMIDEAGQESEEQVVVAPLGAVTPSVLQEGLSRILGASVRTSGSSGGETSPAADRTETSRGEDGNEQAERAERARRAAEFFRRMQQRGGGGFGGGGRGGPGGGGDAGGGRGGRGGR